jgi:hypothetical protein
MEAEEFHADVLSWLARTTREKIELKREVTFIQKEVQKMQFEVSNPFLDA